MDQQSTELVEQLLCTCLARVEDEGSGVVAKVCKDHESLIPEVQRLFGILAGLGLDRYSAEGHETEEGRSSSMNGIQETLGDFHLIRLLGRGGMGAVYLAEDQQLNRRVALKVIRNDFLQEEKARSRFKRETDALARLDHPGLCTIYRAGEDGGLPWISMRYVEGETLDRVLARRRKTRNPDVEGEEGSGTGPETPRRGRRDLGECLVLFEKIARSLQSAHDAGLVHRDLKPGNIMISPEGDPVVLDFGLARDDASDQNLTLSGEQLGTPAYMSPEQVKGEDIDARSDIYSLAVTLFEALTLELPYEGRGREGLFEAIVKGKRRKVSQMRRGLPPELQIVIDKAMDPAPERRYASMQDLAEDLRCVREHQPIQARRSSAHLRLRRWSQRNPVAATILILMGLGLGISLYLLERGNRALQRSHARGYANLAASLMDDKPLHAVELALRSVQIEPRAPESYGRLDEALSRAHRAEIMYVETPDLESFQVDSIRRSPSLEEDRFLLITIGHTFSAATPILFAGGKCLLIQSPEGGVYDADWSDDGSCFVTTSISSVARIWSKSGVAMEKITIPGNIDPVMVAKAKFFPDGDRILFSCNDGILRIWSRSRQEWIWEFESRLCAPRGKRKAPLPIPSLDLDPRGRFCVLGTRAQGVEYVDLVTGDSKIFPRGGARTGTEPSSSRAANMAVSPDGRYIMTQWRSGILALWTSRGEMIRTWGLDGDRCKAVFSPDGQRLLTLRLSKVARLWDLGPVDAPGLELKNTFTGHQGWVVSGCFSPDGRLVATGTANGVAHVWDTETHLKVARLSGSSTMVRAIAFDRKGVSCILTGDTNRVRRFQILDPVLPVLRGTVAGVRAAFELPEGWAGSFVTFTALARVNFFSAAGTLTESLRADISLGGAMALSPSGRWMACSTLSGWVAVLERPNRIVARFRTKMRSPLLQFGPRDSLLCYNYPKGKHQNLAVLSLSADGTWKRDAPEVVEALRGRLGPFWTLAYHERSQRLAVVSVKNKIDIYDSAEEEPKYLRSIDTPGLAFYEIAFSPDGKRILAGASDTTARLWSIEGTRIATLPGHAGRIASVAFSADGRLMMTATPRTGLRLWDRDGRHILSLKPRDGSLTQARFLSDGERVLISSTDGTSRVAWARPDRLIEEARNTQKTVSADLWADYDRLVGK